jgi:hypothetical protein
VQRKEVQKENEVCYYNNMNKMVKQIVQSTEPNKNRFSENPTHWRIKNAAIH